MDSFWVVCLMFSTVESGARLIWAMVHGIRGPRCARWQSPGFGPVISYLSSNGMWP